MQAKHSAQLLLKTRYWLILFCYELQSNDSLLSVSSIGRNLKEWLQEQFCDKPLEQDDMRLHNAAYVGDLDTLRNLLQEDDFKRWEGVIEL